MKKLAVIYDPHNLLQFIWYYCTYSSKDDVWDAVCFPNGEKGEYMSEYCKKSGIFEDVISSDISFLESSLLHQLKLFLLMFLYFIFGKQKAYCKKDLDKYVNIDDYNEIVVLTDHGIIAGEAMTFCDEKKIVVLEDGKGDYMYRDNSNILKNMFSLFDWKGYIIAKMGYANVGHRYPLKTTKGCYKFSSHPEMMKYTEYKKIDKLNDFSYTNMVKYRDILLRTYEELKKYDFEKIDTVVFTCNIDDFTHNTDYYKNKIEVYLEGVGDNILLKKHPRDIMEYELEKSDGVMSLNPTIPAEVLLPLVKGKKIIFFYTSALMLYFDSKYDVSCLYFNELREQSLKEKTYFDYISRNDFEEELANYGIDNNKIVEI